MITKAHIIDTGIPTDWIKMWDLKKAIKYKEKCYQVLEKLNKGKEIEIATTPFFLLTFTIFCLNHSLDVRYVYGYTYPEKTKRRCVYIVLSPDLTKEQEVILTNFKFKGNWILQARLI